MTYDEWVTQVPKSIKQDPLWHFEVYSKALLLADFAWEDCRKLLTTKILDYRCQLLDEIIALLVTHINKQKALAKKQKTSKKLQVARAS